MSNCPTPPTAVVAIVEPKLIRSLVAALERLRFPYRLASLYESGGAVEAWRAW